MELHSILSADNSKAIFPLLLALAAKGLGFGGAKKHVLGKVVKEGTKEVVKDKVQEEVKNKDNKKKSD